MSEQKELLILSILENGEKTEHKIAREIRESDSSVMLIDNEFYYSEELLELLRELTFWGYLNVESIWGDNRLKKYYSLTKSGKKKLEGMKKLKEGV